MMCYYKAPFDNEASPLHLGNIYITMLIKILLYMTVVGILWKWYIHVGLIGVRYFVVYFVTFAALLQVGAIYSNILYFNTPTENLVQATKEELRQGYSDMVLDVGLIKPERLPVLFLFIPLNMVQFLFWRSFENWRTSLMSKEKQSFELSYVQG